MQMDGYISLVLDPPISLGYTEMGITPRGKNVRNIYCCLYLYTSTLLAHISTDMESLHMPPSFEGKFLKHICTLWLFTPPASQCAQVVLMALKLE